MIQAAPLPHLPYAWLLKKKLIANRNRYKSHLLQKCQIIVFVNSALIEYTAITAQAAFNTNITVYAINLLGQIRFSHRRHSQNQITIIFFVGEGFKPFPAVQEKVETTVY
jgi:hypothetical protein